MTQLLQNAAYGTALILAAALLRRGLKDRLIPGARLALWAVCLFRLLTPVAPTSALSLWGLFASLAPGSQPSSPAYSTMSYLPPTTGAFVPQIVEPGTSPDLYLKPAPFPWEKVLPAVWLIVGIALAARYVRGWLRTRRAVACAIPVERSDPRYAPLPRCARLREGPMEGAPLTFGAVKPTVVLSPGLEGEALDCVLAHEGVHARRRDNLWHYVMALALAVHWWNPAVWLMARLLRRDIELSCDRAAVKKLGADRRAEYASALVSMATAAEGPAFCQTFGRKAAEERILSVMKFKKTSVIGVVLSLALVLAVTMAFASEPKGPDAPDTLVVDGVTLTGDAAKYASRLYLGMTRDEVHRLLGEPHGCASGLDAESYVLERIGLPGDEATDPDAPAIAFLYGGSYYGGESKVILARYRVSEGQFVDLFRFSVSVEGDVVECLGQTFSRSQLSQDTQDWLEQYLALSEEERDNILTIPSELCGGQDPSVGDADAGDPTGQKVNDTVEYHGRTYNRADLSQGTLDWLDWYLSLSEEGQMSVSMVPPELIPKGDAAAYDAKAGEMPIGEPELNYDPRVADSVGAGGEPIACPPEAIDKTVSAGSSYHSEGHH